MENNILDDIGFDKEGDGKLLLTSQSSFDGKGMAENFVAVILVTILFVFILSQANQQAFYGFIVVGMIYIMVLLPLLEYIYSDYIKKESYYELRENSIVICQPRKNIHINFQRIRYVLSLDGDEIEIGMNQPIISRKYFIPFKVRKIVLGPMEYKVRFMNQLKVLTGL